MVGHALRVVTRAHGDDTRQWTGRRARLFLDQQCQLVACTSLFKGGGELMVLKLQIDLSAS